MTTDRLLGDSLATDVLRLIAGAHRLKCGHDLRHDSDFDPGLDPSQGKNEKLMKGCRDGGSFRSFMHLAVLSSQRRSLLPIVSQFLAAPHLVIRRGELQRLFGKSDGLSQTAQLRVGGGQGCQAGRVGPIGQRARLGGQRDGHLAVAARGKTWQSLGKLSNTGHVRGMSFPSLRQGWVVGEKGYIEHYAE